MLQEAWHLREPEHVTATDEYLSLQWFRNRIDAKVGIEQWRRHYNDVRPHSSLGYLTPTEFKALGPAREP